MNRENKFKANSPEGIYERALVLGANLASLLDRPDNLLLTGKTNRAKDLLNLSKDLDRILYDYRAID